MIFEVFIFIFVVCLILGLCWQKFTLKEKISELEQLNKIYVDSNIERLHKISERDNTVNLLEKRISVLKFENSRINKLAEERFNESQVLRFKLGIMKKKKAKKTKTKGAKS